MNRFGILDEARSGSIAAFHRKLYQSFPRFVAYCGIMRACRPVAQFKRHGSAIVGLIIPDGADITFYEAAADYAAHGLSVLFGGRDGSEVMVRTTDRKKIAEDTDLSRALAKKRRIVLVAGNPSCVPERFRIAADAILQVGPVLPTHIVAAAKVCLDLVVSQEQAEFIATVPLTISASALRRGRPIATAIALMKEATAPKPRDVSGPSLDDLHGLGEAGEWGRELAADLTDWKAGRIAWADVDRGILVSGPPGTGKTTFAGALAKTCDAHLVLGSLARWQARGHLGDMLRAMRGAFDEARRNTPSIVFIDEIDAAGDREKFNDHNRQYSIEVVAALLECIDGSEGREGVVVVGACNFPDRLDAALVRAGRLDRHVRIPLPDQKAREGILRWHLQGLLPDADLSGIAARTEGWNGASLEQLVRQAKRQARRERREVSVADLAAELIDPVPIPPEVRHRAAIHEAGHALVAIAVGLTSELVSVSIASTIIPDIVALQDGGGVTFKASRVKERTHAQLLDDIAVRLGGIAAEEVIIGERSAGGGGGSGSDLHRATLSALAFEASYGLGESLAYLAPDDEEDLFSALRFDRFLQARIDKLLAGQFKRAKEIVECRKPDVERIVEALLEKGELSAEQLKEILENQPRLKLVDS